MIAILPDVEPVISRSQVQRFKRYTIETTVVVVVTSGGSYI